MVTLNEIAKLANVSVGTVDRVIHNRGRVSEETKKRVQQLIDDLDYKPNVIAQNPQALQLRYLQTLNDISNENVTTIVFPLPIDLIKAVMPKKE